MVVWLRTVCSFNHADIRGEGSHPPPLRGAVWGGEGCDGNPSSLTLHDSSCGWSVGSLMSASCEPPVDLATPAFSGSGRFGVILGLTWWVYWLVVVFCGLICGVFLLVVCWVGVGLVWVLGLVWFCIVRGWLSGRCSGFGGLGWIWWFSCLVCWWWVVFRWVLWVLYCVCGGVVVIVWGWCLHAVGG